MKKEYLEPQLKISYLEFSPLMDQTNADVHTDDPQDPGGALGNSNNVWEEETDPKPNLFSED
jgi:hypothetical protein